MFPFHAGIYGFVFFPPNWTSFENAADPTKTPDFDRLRDSLGNYGYVALAIFTIMFIFHAALGFVAIPIAVTAEVFPFK